MAKGVQIRRSEKKTTRKGAIDSIYHKGGAKAVALISGLPHICVGVSCTTAYGERGFRGWNPAHTPLPKAMHSGKGLCPFSSKSTACVSWSPVLEKTAL